MALEKWLLSPFEDLKLKHAPLLKTLYLGHLGADRALAKFAEQRAACVAYLEELRDIDRRFFDHRGDSESGYTSEHMMFSYFTLRYGIGWMEESVRWCDWAIGEIERHRDLFGNSTARAPIDAPKAARR